MGAGARGDHEREVDDHLEPHVDDEHDGHVEHSRRLRDQLTSAGAAWQWSVGGATERPPLRRAASPI